MKIPSNETEIDNFLDECSSGRIELKGWQHPLGFVHVKVLVAGDDSNKIRFRFWENKMDAMSVGMSDRVHNHAFDFTSFILCGDVLEKRYELIFDSFGSHYVWEVENLGGRSMLRKTSVKCTLKTGEAISHISKSSYKMIAGLFHDAIAVSDCTATLVFETPRPEVASLVICPNDVEKVGDNKWPVVTQDQIISLIKKVIEKRSL